MSLWIAVTFDSAAITLRWVTQCRQGQTSANLTTRQSYQETSGLIYEPQTSRIRYINATGLEGGGCNWIRDLTVQGEWFKGWAARSSIPYKGHSVSFFPATSLWGLCKARASTAFTDTSFRCDLVQFYNCFKPVNFSGGLQTTDSLETSGFNRHNLFDYAPEMQMTQHNIFVVWNSVCAVGQLWASQNRGVSVQCQASSCGIFGGQSGTGADFLLVLPFSPVSTIPPLLHTHSSGSHWHHTILATDSVVKWHRQNLKSKVHSPADPCNWVTTLQTKLIYLISV